MGDLEKLISQLASNGRLEIYQNRYGHDAVHDQPQNIGGGTFIGYKSKAVVPLSSITIDEHLSELEKRLRNETTPMQRAEWLERAKRAVASIPSSGQTVGDGSGRPLAGQNVYSNSRTHQGTGYRVRR